MKKALVSGSTGLLGAHLACNLLKKGYEVVCLHRIPLNASLFDRVALHYGFNRTDFLWVHVNLLDAENLLEGSVGADVFFHCAAKVSFWLKDAQEIYDVNVEGTRNVCNVCLQLNLPLVFVGSVAALGRSDKQDPITENSEWSDSKYNSDYAISKHLAELEVWRAANEGLDVSIISPGIILGVGDGINSSNSMFKYAQSQLPFYPTGTNGFVCVEDVCNAMVLAFENKITQSRILLVAENMSYKSVLQLIAKHLKTKEKTKPLKGAMLSLCTFFASFFEWLRIPFPFPKQGLISTSSESLYLSKNMSLLKDFTLSPIEPEIAKICRVLRSFENRIDA